MIYKIFVNTFIDAIPPIIIFTNPPSKTNGSPQINWMSSEFTKFECSVNAEMYLNCGYGLKGQWSDDSMNDGKHNLSVRGRDSVGNLGQTITHTWIVGQCEIPINFHHFNVIYSLRIFFRNGRTNDNVYRETYCDKSLSSTEVEFNDKRFFPMFVRWSIF